MKAPRSLLAAAWILVVLSGIAEAQTPPAAKPADPPKAAPAAPKADESIEQPAYRSPAMRAAGAVLVAVGVSAGLAGASVSFAEVGHAFDRDPKVASPYPIMAAALFGASGAFILAGIPLWALGAREPLQKTTGAGSLRVLAGPGSAALRLSF